MRGSLPRPGGPGQLNPIRRRHVGRRASLRHSTGSIVSLGSVEGHSDRAVAVSGGITSRSRCEESQSVTLIVCASHPLDRTTCWPTVVPRDPIYHAQPDSHCGDQGGQLRHRMSGPRPPAAIPDALGCGWRRKHQPRIRLRGLRASIRNAVLTLQDRHHVGAPDLRPPMETETVVR